MKLALCPLAVALSLACSPAVLLAQDQRVFNENEITVESVADSLQPIKLRGVKRRPLFKAVTSGEDRDLCSKGVEYTIPQLSAATFLNWMLCTRSLV